MSMSNSEARKRAAEKAVEALKAEVWDEAIEAFGRSLLSPLREDGTREQFRNPYRSEAGR